MRRAVDGVSVTVKKLFDGQQKRLFVRFEDIERVPAEKAVALRDLQHPVFIAFHDTDHRIAAHIAARNRVLMRLAEIKSRAVWAMADL